MDDAVAIHSSESVTCDNFGRGRDAYCRQTTTDVYNENNSLFNIQSFRIFTIDGDRRIREAIFCIDTVVIVEPYRGVIKEINNRFMMDSNTSENTKVLDYYYSVNETKREHFARVESDRKKNNEIEQDVLIIIIDQC